ncbi:uncharacterized protein KIAA1958-like [Mizuhopecten yessoensis]|uniref:uncharacterized protein KIAA1958-like n=1 Tax=Mizuhopecten yessoensis TaxID=6573 RepID=UPI000B45D921|nr:uncharacterized protein KIAA1958-like [Mizuhopecten yessoensis]
MELDDLIDKQKMAKEHDEAENVVLTETINEVMYEDETVCNEAESTRHFVEQMRNINTVRKTVSDLNKFTTWLKSKNEQRQQGELDSKELDQYLALFFMNAQKSNGGEFEQDTLKSIQSSINRHLKQKGLTVDIISDREFTHSREVFASKRKLLRQHGKGNRAKQATEEIGIMYAKNLLGKANPRALFNTIYINNTLHLGMRSREEHAHLRWGDVEMKASSTGEGFLEFTERATKTKNGVNGGSRPYLPKRYEDNGNPRCPVMIYQEYAARRAVSMKRDEDPFYLGVHKKCNENSEYRYVLQPMDKNTLGCIVKTMCESQGS